MSAGACYVCGSAELAADADPRSPTCERCRPARAHVVSMQRDQGSGEYLAICQCGWTVRRRTWGARDFQVLGHWRSVIEAAS